jgi:Fe2+ transport system protein B
MPENFRGSTIACETFRDGGLRWVDTPGIVRDSDTTATRAAFEELKEADCVMLVARADRAVEELSALLSAAAGKPGFVVLTFADRLESGGKMNPDELASVLGVPVFLVDARHLDEEVASTIRKIVAAPVERLERFPKTPPANLPVSTPALTAKEGPLERTVSQPFIALLLLFLPAAVSIVNANRFADWLYDPVAKLLEPVLSAVATWPGLIAALLGGDYGLLAMFPFLILYALPTIVVFSAILAIYKSTGLIERMSIALHPYLRPFGIGGRDLVRVVMGFGCNVPAVISTRACHCCSRRACISAISFGSACSYQLPATLAVFAAAGLTGMGFVYLALLAITTLIYLRFTTPKVLRLASNSLVRPSPDPLSAPSWRSVGRDMLGNLQQFVVMAFPIFIVICFVAAALGWLGVLDGLSGFLAPVLSLFNLPGEAATSVVLGSIRKDGIAIGLLEGSGGGLKVALGSPAQVLTAVYLAGVLLPCLVTVFTIAREMRWKFAIRLCVRQIAWACAFGLVIGWGGGLFF